MNTLENRDCGHVKPVYHLAWVDGQRPEYTHKAIAEACRRKCREHCCCSLHFCIVIKLRIGMLSRGCFLGKMTGTYALDRKIQDRTATVRCGGRNNGSNNMLYNSVIK